MKILTISDWILMDPKASIHVDDVLTMPSDLYMGTHRPKVVFESTYSDIFPWRVKVISKRFELYSLYRTMNMEHYYLLKNRMEV